MSKKYFIIRHSVISLAFGTGIEWKWAEKASRTCAHFSEHLLAPHPRPLTVKECQRARPGQWRSSIERTCRRAQVDPSQHGTRASGGESWKEKF